MPKLQYHYAVVWPASDAGIFPLTSCPAAMTYVTELLCSLSL